MSRPLRPNLPETFHHVMNRAIDRGPAFRDDSDRVEFGQRLADIFERFGIVTHAYCLMTTHFHLLLECPNGALSEAMQRLSSMYTRHVNDRLGRDGAIFRGRFASRLIDSDEYLLMACRYVHRNALDLPGVADVSEYRWSSHRTYLGCGRHRRGCAPTRFWAAGAATKRRSMSSSDAMLPTVDRRSIRPACRRWLRRAPWHSTGKKELARDSLGSS